MNCIGYANNKNGDLNYMNDWDKMWFILVELGVCRIISKKVIFLGIFGFHVLFFVMSDMYGL